MTAQELIDELSQLPPDQKIVVSAYERGYNDPVVTKEVVLYTEPDGEGDFHGRYDDRPIHGSHETFVATVIAESDLSPPAEKMHPESPEKPILEPFEPTPIDPPPE